VVLEWAPNSEPDLAGYYVYRAFEDGPFVRITPEPVPATTYTDIVTRGTWSYYVTAVDIADNESDPSNVVEFRSPDFDFSIGEPDPSPYLVSRTSYTRWGRGAVHDADLDSTHLAYRKTDLNPDSSYTAAVMFCLPPGVSPVYISLFADDTALLRNYVVTGRPMMYVMLLPHRLYEDGCLEFAVSRVSGQVAAVSEVYLWEGRPRLGGPQSDGETGKIPARSAAVYPNPARSVVRIRLGVQRRYREPVCVCDAQGRLVRRLRADGPVLTWDGRDGQGRELPAGVYWLKLETGSGAAGAKVVRLR